MRRPWAALAALATLGLARASGGPKPDPPDVLAAILGAHPEWFASVVANADEHRRAASSCRRPSSPSRS